MNFKNLMALTMLAIVATVMFGACQSRPAAAEIVDLPEVKKYADCLH